MLFLGVVGAVVAVLALWTIAPLVARSEPNPQVCKDRFSKAVK